MHKTCWRARYSYKEGGRDASLSIMWDLYMFMDVVKRGPLLEAKRATTSIMEFSVTDPIVSLITSRDL